MKTNLEKWNYYKAELDKQADIFMDSLLKEYPDKFYRATVRGNVETCFITGRVYSFGPEVYYFTKKPTKKNVEEIKSLYENKIIFDEKKAFFNFKYCWGVYDGQERFASTAILISDIINQKDCYLTEDIAKIEAGKIKEAFEAKKLFLETHKKDTSYNYAGNGYKFLGWMNGWSHVYYDEDGKITTGDESKGEKPKRSFGYEKDKYPEYKNCIDSNHQRIEVQHTRSGSENTVSCPICKIYWKYDCSG